MSVAFAESTTSQEMHYTSIRFVYFGVNDGEGIDSRSRVEVVRQNHKSELLIDHQNKQAIWFEPTLILMSE